jgi:hypothetical protein
MQYGHRLSGELSVRERQTKLLSEQVDSRIVEVEEAAPFQNARFPERHRLRKPQRELSKPRLRERLAYS